MGREGACTKLYTVTTGTEIAAEWVVEEAYIPNATLSSQGPISQEVGERGSLHVGKGEITCDMLSPYILSYFLTVPIISKVMKPN